MPNGSRAAQSCLLDAHLHTRTLSAEACSGFIPTLDEKVNSACRPRLRFVRLRVYFVRIDRRVEFRIVIHLQLAIELETALAGEHLGPECVETSGKFLALLLQQLQTFEISLAVRHGCACPAALLRRVIQLERKDGEPV
jgi:hypothetical protein